MDEAWQEVTQSWRAAFRWLAMSYVQALAADGDGMPNWFWPSVLLASVTSIAMGGFALVVTVYLLHRTDQNLKQVVDYVVFVLPWYAGFCIADISVWLGFRGWSKHMTRPLVVTQATTAGAAVTTKIETTTGGVT